MLRPAESVRPAAITAGVGLFYDLAGLQIASVPVVFGSDAAYRSELRAQSPHTTAVQLAGSTRPSRRSAASLFRPVMHCAYGASAHPA